MQEQSPDSSVRDAELDRKILAIALPGKWARTPYRCLMHILVVISDKALSRHAQRLGHSP